MKNFLFLTTLLITSFIYASDIVTVAPINYIEQEEEPKNFTDSQGKKQGPWIYFGKDMPEKGYPEEGKVKEGPYTDNRKHGVWTTYHKDGITPRVVGKYVNGRPKGDYTKSFSNGQIKEQGTFGNKKMTGSLKRYFEDGTVSQEKSFNAEGKEDGPQKMYHPNGQLWLEYEKVNGIKTGKKVMYTETGDIKQIITYDASGEILTKEDIEVKKPEIAIKTEGGNGPTGVGKNTNGKPFEKNGYNKTYNADKELEMDGKFKNGRLWDGILYKYDSDGILLKIEIWKSGKYHSEGQI